MPRRSILSVIPTLLLVSACQQPQQQPPPQPTETPQQRGEYLVSIMGCGDCHTPMTFGPTGPTPIPGKNLSGHPGEPALPPPPALAPGPWFIVGTMTAWSGPWGISYGMNLTPDPETGIGAWTEDVFVKSMRTGMHVGPVPRPILPPMPWQVVNHLKEDDLKAVFAYLMSIPPVKNRVPEAVLAPPPGGTGQ